MGSSADASPARILVVDDDRSITRIVRSMLEVEGHEVEEAVGSEGLVERVVQRPPDLLLLDACMPGMSGIESLAVIRERLGDSLPVLMLSGAGDSRELADQARRLGALECLLKPVAMDRLHACVRLCLTIGRLKRENQELRVRLRETRVSERG